MNDTERTSRPVRPTRRHRLRLLGGAAALTLLAVTPVAGAAVSTPTAATTANPFSALRSSGAPKTVGYAVGERIYSGGRATSMISAMTRGDAAKREMSRVITSRGVTYAQFIALGVDLVYYIGRVTPAHTWKHITTSIGGGDGFTATTGGLLILPAVPDALTSTGRRYASAPELSATSGIPIPMDSPDAVGARVLIRRPLEVGAGTSSFLWYPKWGTMRLPDGTRAVGRLGQGWIGVPVAGRPGCWRTAPAGAPGRLRAAICSQTLPLVDASGGIAITSTGGRLRVSNTLTGKDIRTISVPAVAQSRTRHLIPAAWENATTFLATGRFDSSLVLLRCSTSSGACTVAVRSTVRGDVSQIVTERGLEALLNQS